MLPFGQGDDIQGLSVALVAAMRRDVETCCQLLVADLHVPSGTTSILPNTT